MPALPNKRRWLSPILYLCSAIIIVNVFFLSWGDVKAYPGVDLRAKVVGARRLALGLDPYNNPYLEVAPDRLRTRLLNTYSPALLALYIPLSNLNWDQQRLAYFAFDWIAILLCFALLARVSPPTTPKATLLFLCVLLIVGDYSFRAHLERGQYYVGLALLTALASVCIHEHRDSWIHAAPLALLMLFRPTYVIVAVGLYLWGRKAYVKRIVIVICAVVVLLMPLTGFSAWQNYASRIKQFQNESLLRLNGIPTSEEAHANEPAVFEGVDFSNGMNLQGYQADRTFIGVVSGSLGAKQTAPLVTRLGLRNPHLVAKLNTVGLLSVAVFGLIVMLGLSKSPQSSLIPIAFAFLMPMDLELFSPQRYAYGDVTMLAPLLLVLATILSKKSVRGSVLIAALLVFGAALPWLALHFESHVPLVSFIKYASTLLILNVICVREAWMAWSGARSKSLPATGVESVATDQA